MHVLNCKSRTLLYIVHTDLCPFLIQQQKTALIRNNSALQNVTLRTKSENFSYTHIQCLNIFSLLLLPQLVFLLPFFFFCSSSLSACCSPLPQNVVLFYFIAPGMRERPTSAIYPSDSFRQSLLGSRRGRSGLSLSKSVSTNNIAG